MTRYLVTGAGGFIGHELATALSAEGHDVIGIDLGFPTDTGAVSFQQHILDFRDEAAIAPLMQNVEVVFHLASAHLRINLNATEYWDINVHSVPKLMALTHHAGVRRFVHVSSVGIYGNLKSWPANEESACHPQSIYGETKLAGEAVVRDYATESGLATVILRPAWVYGPTCPRTRKLHQALKSGKFLMIGAGKNMRHPLYIKDMIAACRLAAEKAEAVGQTMIIGGDRAIETRELIDTMCRVFGLRQPPIRLPFIVGQLLATTAEFAFTLVRKEPPVSRRTLEFFDTNNAFDISLSRQLLEFQPQYSFEAGLEDMATDFEE